MMTSIIICLLCLVHLSLSQPLVTTSTGIYVGQKLTTYSGVKYNSFRGIKYAEVPGRFEEALPVKKSLGTFVADTFGDSCYQNVSLLESKVPISEDCLYLNVYSPNLTSSLPVIVFIHGGFFMSGSTSFYGPDYFMDTKKVVTVTISYRLGAFGFLFLDRDDYSVNNGIRDQILALKWIKKNVKHFGGNPAKITINGQGAGASSVALLMYSPLAQDLFVGAISESGSASGRWSLQPRCTGLQRLIMLAKLVGCGDYIQTLPPKTSDDLVECLRNKSPEEIVTATDEFPIWMKYSPFPPIVESSSNPVISFYPWMNELKSANLVPWITGVNSNQGLATRSGLIPSNMYLELGRLFFSDFTLPDMLLYRYLTPTLNIATIRIMQHYLDSYYNYNTTLPIQVTGDGFYYYPMINDLQVIGSPTYAYYFNYRLPYDRAGVAHGGELKYIWPSTPIIQQNGSSSDIQASNNLVNTWVSFAYNQLPTYGKVTWNKYDYRQDEVLIIDNAGARMGPNPNSMQNKFWEGLNLDTSPRSEYCMFR